MVPQLTSDIQISSTPWVRLFLMDMRSLGNVPLPIWKDTEAGLKCFTLYYKPLIRSLCHGNSSVPQIKLHIAAITYAETFSWSNCSVHNDNPLQYSGEFHGHRNLASYSPWGHRESDTTQWLSFIHLPARGMWIMRFYFLSIYHELYYLNRKFSKSRRKGTFTASLGRRMLPTESGILIPLRQVKGGMVKKWTCAYFLTWITVIWRVSCTLL